jgi:hypothetical protein
MKSAFRMLLFASVGSIAGLAVAQQPGEQGTAGRPVQDKKTPASLPAANPEQEVLRRWVGDWEATIESTGRDGKPARNQAKATVRLAYGNRWLVTEFDGTFLGAPFSGQELLGYDPIAKKYILTWIDSAATSFSTGEGTFDPKANTMTFTVSGRDDRTGKTATWRQVDVWRDADNHEWTIRTTSEGGKEQIQMTIRYRRKG